MKAFKSRTATVAAIAAIVVFGGGAGAYASGALNGDSIKQGSVDSTEIQNNSLQGADIRDESITSADVDNGTLTGADVKDASLTGADLAPGSVGTGDIADGTVGSADIENGSVSAADLRPDVADYVAQQVANGRLSGQSSESGTYGNGASIPVGGGSGLMSLTATLKSESDAPVRLRVEDGSGQTLFSCSAHVFAGGWGDTCSASGIVANGPFTVRVDGPAGHPFEIALRTFTVVVGG